MATANGKRKLPEQLLVFGKKIKVKLVPGLVESEGILGQYNPVKLQIIIDSGLSEAEQWSTLIHELCHSMFHRCGYKQGIHHQLEETMCETISNIFLENFNITSVK